MACIGINQLNYTGTFALGANALDVNGIATLGGVITGSGNISVSSDIGTEAGTDFTGYTGKLIHDDAAANTDLLTTNGATLPDFELANAGVTSFAMQDDAEVGDFKANVAGSNKFADGGFTLRINGDLANNRDMATNTSTGTWILQGTTGTLGWDTNEATVLNIAVLSIASGSTYTLSDDVFCDTLAGSGTLLKDGGNVRDLTIQRPAGNNFWPFAGTITAKVIIEIADDRSNATAIVHTGSSLMIQTPFIKKLTMNGDLSTSGTLVVAGTGAGDVMTLDVNGNALTAGATTVGVAGLDRSGVILCGGGIIKITSLIDGGAANLNNAIALESCYLEASGTLDFDNIAHSAAADDVVHIVCTGTGEVTNFDPVKIVHVHGDATVDGGGNNTVNNVTTFNTHAAPGSMRLMGVGVA